MYCIADLRTQATDLASAITERFGSAVGVVHEQAIGGGSISAASVATLSDGTRVLLKRNRAAHAGLFEEEARGLRALQQSPDGPRVPHPLALVITPSQQILLMEYIEPGPRAPDYSSTLGRQLACLHRSFRHAQCGFVSDNHIGSTPQQNGWDGDWHRFFGEQRLGAQIRLAAQQGLANRQMIEATERIIARLPELLPRPDAGRPSLLHGDLWAGNAIVGPAGEPVIIDPATYFGHREADLAMTELFGGFSADFYASYDETWPLEPGYSQRRDLYNLYHLLNHLNLFGSSYAAPCLNVLQRYR